VIAATNFLSRVEKGDGVEKGDAAHSLGVKMSCVPFSCLHTFPNGFVLTDNDASGLNGDIRRRSSLSASGGTLESDDDLGLVTVVRRSHPQPYLDLAFPGTGPGTRRAAGSSADS
jgi:hypothetical protein